MSALHRAGCAVPEAIPELRFAVEGAAAVPYAAVPTLAFALRIEAPGGHSIRSVLLDVQIQIAARQRGYEPEVQERLLELFGLPERWGSTLRTLPWLRTTAVVPPFTGESVVSLEVPCTYDLEITAARYFAALRDGLIPLEFLFSGTVFYLAADGALQTSRIAWENEVDHRLPVAVWKQTLERHFRDVAWLRLQANTFDRLCRYKARHAFESWEAAVEALLGDGDSA